MRNNAAVFIFALILMLPACGKTDEKDNNKSSTVVSPNRGPVNLGQPQQGNTAGPAKSGAYQGLDPAKVKSLSPEARRVLEASEELRQKRLKNPTMTDREYMGELPKPPKF